MNLEAEIKGMARRAKRASRDAATLPTATKNAWCLRAADQLESRKAQILAANAADVEQAAAKGVAKPLLGRLRLTQKRWHTMLEGLADVAALPDPVGEIEGIHTRPSGVRVGRMRIPLGVIGIIYESRPNVTVDAAALCVKAGNATLLRGGSEAIRANLELADALRAAARATGVPEDAIQVVPHTDRAAIDVMLRSDEYIDLIVPRGGSGLIEKVKELSRIPVIAHDAGVCHVFLDASADAEMATAIAIDSKIEKMAVCNALETLLVHQAAARSVMPTVLRALHERGVELRGCQRTCAIFPEAKPATEEDYHAEYLAPILAVRVVDDMQAAIAHIAAYGSDHTEVIVTNDLANAEGFVRRVPSSTVGVNCSTGFADGYQLGLGAEIGISTSKLHAYGPMGLEGLTTRKFVVFGEGQTIG